MMGYFQPNAPGEKRLINFTTVGANVIVRKTQTCAEAQCERQRLKKEEKLTYWIKFATSGL